MSKKLVAFKIAEELHVRLCEQRRADGLTWPEWGEQAARAYLGGIPELCSTTGDHGQSVPRNVAVRLVRGFLKRDIDHNRRGTAHLDAEAERVVDLALAPLETAMVPDCCRYEPETDKFHVVVDGESYELGPGETPAKHATTRLPPSGGLGDRIALLVRRDHRSRSAG
jgi:hypothetical protein